MESSLLQFSEQPQGVARLKARDALSRRIHKALNPDLNGGQVLTPWNVAQYMADVLMHQSAGSFVDAGAGYGMLSDASELRGAIINPNQAFLVDLDDHAIQFLEQHPPIPGAHVLQTDFVTWSLQQETGMDYVVANPPYLASKDYDTGLVDTVNQALGTEMTKLTNLFALFLVCGANLLNDNGRCVVLIPTEIFTTNFGAKVIQTLPEGIHLRQVHLFTDANEPFLKHGVTSCALVLEKGAPAPIQIINIQGNQESPLTGELHRELSQTTLHASPKDTVMGLLYENAQGMCTMRDLFNVHRGMATGANDVFMLTQEQRDAIDPEGIVTQRCIKNVGYVPSLSYTVTDHDASLRSGHPEWQLRVQDIHDAPPGVREHLLKAESRDVHLNTMVASRRPWFKPETHEPAPLLIPSMFRGHARVITNFDLVPTLTTFHRCIPKTPLTEPQLRFLAAWFSTPDGQMCLRQTCRRLGNLAFRTTPNDILSVHVPDIRTIPINILIEHDRDIHEALLNNDLESLHECVNEVLTKVPDIEVR